MVGHVRERAIAVLVLVAIIAVPATVSGSATLAPTSDATVPASTDAPSALEMSGPPAQVTPTNNSTVHHRNPEEVQEFGDIYRVRAWLSNDLFTRLSAGTIRLEQGQYEAARRVIGDGYNDRLDQFVDVAGQTYTDDDDDEPEAFRDVQRTQRNYTNTVEQYEQNYEQYERAIENDNRSRARREARQLSETATRVRALNRSVVDDYRQLANRTGNPLPASLDRITNVSQNISERQQRVERTLFTETELRLQPERTEISFVDPLTATGRLVTADGEPVANREITLEVYTRERTVRTDESGSFKLRYRPRAIPVTRSAVNVTYLPAAESEFRSSNASVDVAIKQVNGTLSTAVDPGTVAYGDQLAVDTTLTVDGEPVSDVRVRAEVDGSMVATRTLNESGGRLLRSQLSATVSPGRQQVTVTAGNETTAVTASNDTVALTVRETETTLTLERGSLSGDRVRVVGRLETARGEPASAQTVALRVQDGPTVTTATDDRGRYAVALQRSQLDPGPEANVQVTATFNGSGLNLNGSSVTRQIDISVGNSSEGEGSADDQGPFGGLLTESGLGGTLSDAGGSLEGALLVAGLLVVLVGLVVARRSLISDGAGEAGDTDAESEPSDPATGATDASPEPEAAGGSTGGLELAPGQSFLQSGEEVAALQYTYQHLRGQVAESFGVADADTHWEFFNACRDGGMEAAKLDALRAVVEAYETATFHEDPTVDGIDSLLEAVESNW